MRRQSSLIIFSKNCFVVSAAVIFWYFSIGVLIARDEIVVLDLLGLQSRILSHWAVVFVMKVWRAITVVY